MTRGRIFNRYNFLFRSFGFSFRLNCSDYRFLSLMMIVEMITKSNNNDEDVLVEETI